MPVRSEVYAEAVATNKVLTEELQNVMLDSRIAASDVLAAEQAVANKENEIAMLRAELANARGGGGAPIATAGPEAGPTTIPVSLAFSADLVAMRDEMQRLSGENASLAGRLTDLVATAKHSRAQVCIFFFFFFFFFCSGPFVISLPRTWRGVRSLFCEPP